MKNWNWNEALNEVLYNQFDEKWDETDRIVYPCIGCIYRGTDSCSGIDACER